MERSQRTEEALEGTETTQRKRLERRDNLFGQVGCMVESSEKSMEGTGGRGWTEEAGNGGEARGGNGEGWEKASATTFWEPGRRTRLLVNSERKDNCVAAGRTKVEKPWTKNV